MSSVPVTPKLTEVKKVSVLEQLKKLDDQRAKLVEDAKNEALDKAKAAITDLNGLGFSYRLVEGEDGKSKGRKATRQRDPNVPCSICKFVTEPPHDGRMHRSQGDNKKPFNATELKEFSLTKKA